MDDILDSWFVSFLGGLPKFIQQFFFASVYKESYVHMQITTMNWNLLFPAWAFYDQWISSFWEWIHIWITQSLQNST